MSGKTAKLISPERVKRILECYGSNPETWPEDEKVAALSLIQHSRELHDLQQQTAELDNLLKSADSVVAINDEPGSDELLNKIVNALPEQDRKPDPRFANHLPNSKKSFFDLNHSLGAIAASLAVVAISMSIVTLSPTNINPEASVASSQSVLDEWMWEQVMGEPADEAEEPLSMMALLELEEL